MSDDEINRAIAEACGWKPNGAGYWHKNGDVRALSYEAAEGRGRDVRPLPSYTTDLNAMHEAESACIRGHADMEYRETLEHVCNEGYAAIIYATARQRAEAFLRTIGKWKDNEPH